MQHNVGKHSVPNALLRGSKLYNPERVVITKEQEVPASPEQNLTV